MKWSMSGRVPANAVLARPLLMTDEAETAAIVADALELARG